MLYNPLLNWTTQHQITPLPHNNNKLQKQHKLVLPQGWGCRGTPPGPDGAAGCGSGRSVTVFPGTSSDDPCWRLSWWSGGRRRRRLLSLRGERRDWDCPEWLPIWTKEAPLIEPRWAGVGRLPRPSGAPPSEPRLLAFTGVIHTLVSTLLLSLQLSPSEDVTHTDTHTHT